MARLTGPRRDSATAARSRVDPTERVLPSEALSPEAVPPEAMPTVGKGGGRTSRFFGFVGHLRTFESLRDRDFRWFYLAMLGQMAAMNMQLLVRGALTYHLTGSYAALGLVGLANALPMLFLSPFGGVMADRLPKRTVLILGQASSLVIAVAVAALLFADLLIFEYLVLSAVVQGVVMALMMPSRQAMIPDLVGRAMMMNAISLNMAGMNTMRLFAPAIGGFIIAWWNFELAYVAMAGLYVVAIVGMLQVTWSAAVTKTAQGTTARQVVGMALVDIKEGAVYIARTPLMRTILSVTVLSSMFGMPYLFLLPGYVADIFAGDGADLGLLISSSAVGSLVGALVLASLPNKHRGRVLLIGMAIMGAALIVFPLTTNFFVAIGIILFLGLGSALRQALSQGLLLAYVDEAYRGRVMAVFLMQFSIMQLGVFL
ncbi:MAG: MFS transporter, partial [Dehalococcoidia bacterium]